MISILDGPKTPVASKVKSHNKLKNVTNRPEE